MNINPSSPQGPRPAGPDSLEANRASEARSKDAQQHQAESQRAAAKADSAEVSAEARALAEGSAARRKDAGLSADRLKEIGERLATGFYDRPEVIDRVAERIHRDPNFRAE